jgi:Gpi18-like mannosyltransferase
VTRAAIVAVDAFAGAFVKLNLASCIACMPTGIDAVDDWARWDGRWYVEIVEHGYSYDPDAQSSVAFFPLYPLLIRLLTLPFGSNHVAIVVAGLILSNLALVAALLVVTRFARTEIGPEAAGRVPLVLLVFPSTVFLSAAYPESLMLLLAALAFVEAREKRWWRAGILAALGTLTKPSGITVAAALLLEAARQRGEGRRALLPLALSPLAALLWWAYLTALTGEPWAFFLTQTKFRHHPGLFGAVGELFDPAAYSFPYFVGALFAITCILVIVGWRRLSSTVSAHGTLMIAFMLGNGTLSSSMRYEINVLAAFLVLATMLRGRRTLVVFVGVSMALALLLAAMFSLQYWIG